MKKTLKRLLACCLSVAVLISCCVSGLVLPVAAFSAGNLFPNGDMEGTLTGTWERADRTTVNATAGFGGGAAWEILAGKYSALPAVTLAEPLEMGKHYVFRFKQSGGKGIIALSGAAWANLVRTEYNFTSPSNGWNEVFVPFTVSAQATTLPEIYFYNNNTTGSVYYDDFAVYEYSKGMNVVPGADGTAYPITTNHSVYSMFGNFTLSLAEDGENAVWQFGGLNAAGTSNYLRLMHLKNILVAGDEVDVSFRYKGTDATLGLESANTANAVISNANTTAADEHGWKTYTATVKFLSVSETILNETLKLAFSGATEVLVDDFYLGQVDLVEIAETSVTVEEGQSVTLNAISRPEGNTITWSSSDETIATVENGVVTGVDGGTVTITATIASGKFDTCEVTVATDDLFPNGDMDGTLTGNWENADKVTVNATAGVNGSAAWEIFAGKYTTLPAATLTKPLEVGKQYVFRFKQSGGKGIIALTGGAWANLVRAEYNFTSPDNGWVEVIVPFTVSAQSATLPQVYFYNNNTTGSVYYDDFAVYEYTKGMNLVPGADGAAHPITTNHNAYSMFGNFTLSLAEDGENAVWQFSGLNAASTSKPLRLMHLQHILKAGDEVDISLSYKGTDAAVGLQSTNTANVVVKNENTGAADENGWKTYTATVKFNNISETILNEMLNLTFSGATEVLVDDIYLGQVDFVDIVEATATVEEGKTVTLNATTDPAGAAIVWSSSDTTTATVENGVVTGIDAGTVTITATIAGNRTDTCEVTVTTNDLFPSGDMEGTLTGNWENADRVTVNATAGFGGGAAWEIFAGKYSALPAVTLTNPLEVGKQYVFRFKQSGGKGIIALSGGAWANLVRSEYNFTSPTNGWNEVIVPFTVSAQSATLPAVYFYNNNTTGSVYYDDFAVYEYTEGMNLVPGADGAAHPITTNQNAYSMFGNFTLSLAEDGENAVWQFGGLNAAGTSNYLRLMHLQRILAAEDEVEISLSYKGTDATVSLISANAANAVISHANTTAADENGWKTYTATVKFLSISEAILNETLKLTFSGATQVLVDDFYLGQVTSVDIVETTATVEEGATVTLNATVEPADAAIEWTSSDNTIATVENGVVTGVAIGTATITATIDSGKFDTCQVTVTEVQIPDITGIAWQYQQGNTQEVAPDNYVQLSVGPVPANAILDGTVVWSVADPSIATVDQNGEVKGISEGTTTVTASVAGLAPITLELVVDYYAPVFSEGDFANPNANWAPLPDEGGIIAGIGENGTAGYQIYGNKNVYYKGSPLTLIPGNKYEMSVRYKSSINPGNNQFVSFEGLGQINLTNTNGEWTTKTVTKVIPASWYYHNYSLCIGSTSMANLEDGMVIDSITVRLADTGVDMESFTLIPQEKQLLSGQSLEYVVWSNPADANVNFVTWTSSNEDVAIVEYGKVFAVGAGTATITATVPTSNGFKTATSTITVTGDGALIKNGTFDKATDTSWQTLNGAAVAAQGFNETNGAVLDGTNESVVQTLTGMTAGSSYSLRLRYTGNRSATIRIKAADGSAVYHEKTVSTSAAWSETTTNFTLPSDCSTALVFEAVATGTAGTIVLDNISLTEGFSQADLIVSDISWNNGETQIVPGTPVNVTAVIGNAGTEATNPAQDIVVELRVNANTIYTWTHEGGLAAGQSVTLTTDSENPWLAQAGELVISAHVNTTGTVRESNTINNGIQANIRVANEALVAPQQALDGGFNKLVFSDDFTTLDTIDGEHTGDYGYKWYFSDLSGICGDLTDVSLTEDGIMLAGKRTRFNWLMGTIDARTGAGWEGFTHGYMEFRSRFSRNPNVPEQTMDGAPAVWSFQHETIAPNVFGKPERSVEVDWMEYWGEKFPQGTWTVTLHDNYVDQNGTYYNSVSNNPHNFVANAKPGEANDIGDGEWHTIGYRWSEGLIICYVDGTEVWRQEWGEDGVNPVPNGTLRDDLFDYIDEQVLALLLGGGAQHPMELDYIRVWQN